MAVTSATPGPAKVSSSSSRASAVQCVPVSGQWLVIAWANAFVDADAGADDPPQAELDVSFFDAADCRGVSTLGFHTPPTAVTGAWTTVQAGNVTSTTNQSVSIELVVASKTGADVDAYFDNVMLKTQGL